MPPPLPLQSLQAARKIEQACRNMGIYADRPLVFVGVIHSQLPDVEQEFQAIAVNAKDGKVWVTLIPVGAPDQDNGK